MTSFTTLLLTLTAFITVKVGHIHGKCRFPDFLQRSHPWAGDYKDGGLVAYVKPSLIMLRESFDGGATHTFNKECVKRGPDNKFLVRLTEDGHPTKYQCLQFLSRSDNIVQIKTSDRFDRQTMEICQEERMRIDPFPLVQLGQERNKSLACPFVGGYNFYAYYPRPNNTLVCKNNRLLMRMESECERGGGIEFDFRKEYCVPKGLPRNPIQKAHCVAHWTQGMYTFLVLQHAQEPDKWWCMRISDPLTDITEAYLWMQVVCDASPEPNPEISSNYLKLGFSRRVFSSTCADEIQVCQAAQRVCDANYKQHCALTCGECMSEDQIGLCTFDEQYRGQWMDSGQKGDFLIDVETYTIRGSDLGNYNCLNLDTDIYTDKRVLLEIYDNGCLPRYACAEMSKVNSSVMKFRLGDRHAWPLPNVKSQKEYICKPSNFQIHHRAESRYIKERPSRLIVNTRDIKEVPCGLPPRLQNGIAFLEDGRRCGGCLYYNPNTNPNQFVVRPVNCSDETTDSEPTSRFRSIPISYSCMASFSFHNGSYSVITKTTSFNTGMGQYLIWTFTGSHQIKVMKASEAYVYAHNKHLKSEYILAQFSILRHSEDKSKCRMNTYYPLFPTTTTTTTTTQSNLHWIDHRRGSNRTRTTPGQNPNKGGKYTYYPNSDAPQNPDPKATPYPSKSGNLRGGENKGNPSSVYHCSHSFYSVIWVMASLVTSWTLTQAPVGLVSSLFVT